MYVCMYIYICSTYTYYNAHLPVRSFPLAKIVVPFPFGEDYDSMLPLGKIVVACSLWGRLHFPFGEDKKDGTGGTTSPHRDATGKPKQAGAKVSQSLFINLRSPWLRLMDVSKQAGDCSTFRKRLPR